METRKSVMITELKKKTLFHAVCNTNNNNYYYFHQNEVNVKSIPAFQMWTYVIYDRGVHLKKIGQKENRKPKKAATDYNIIPHQARRASTRVAITRPVLAYWQSINCCCGYWAGLAKRCAGEKLYWANAEQTLPHRIERVITDSRAACMVWCIMYATSL